MVSPEEESITVVEELAPSQGWDLGIQRIFRIVRDCFDD